ncbi:MAG: hypothetical protein PVH19_08320 [Planctomycetia bacterium]|jgi:hypothetical protein
MCENTPNETVSTPEADEASCVCSKLCDDLKQKIKDIDAKEVFDATMNGVRKQPLLGVLIAGVIGYFLGRLSKKIFG